MTEKGGPAVIPPGPPPSGSPAQYSQPPPTSQYLPYPAYPPGYGPPPPNAPPGSHYPPPGGYYPYPYYPPPSHGHPPPQVGPAPASSDHSHSATSVTPRPLEKGAVGNSRTDVSSKIQKEESPQGVDAEIAWSTHGNNVNGGI